MFVKHCLLFQHLPHTFIPLEENFAASVYYQYKDECINVFFKQHWYTFSGAAAKMCQFYLKRKIKPVVFALTIKICGKFSLQNSRLC